jgi:transcription elongation factor Elf1
MAGCPNCNSYDYQTVHQGGGVWLFVCEVCGSEWQETVKPEVSD